MNLILAAALLLAFVAGGLTTAWVLALGVVLRAGRADT